MRLVPTVFRLSAYSHILRLASIVPIVLLAGFIGLYFADYVTTVFELERIEKILLLATWSFCAATIGYLICAWWWLRHPFRRLPDLQE